VGDTTDQIVNSWKASAPHRAALLGSVSTHVGVGAAVTTDGRTVYVFQGCYQVKL
jgi:uncharacterized protein YkwD